jgi:hypothetical protein
VPDAPKTAVAQLRGPLFALLPAIISLVVPATAWADIYKWTDEKGGITYSDSPPPAPAKVRNLEVVEKETNKPTPTEQALLARIQNLERQLQAPKYAAQAPPAQPPAPYGGYSPSMPPPSNYYDNRYDGSYDSGYYPAYYPGYPYAVPVYSYAVRPRRTFFVRPGFAAPGGRFAHAGGGHMVRR